MSLFNDFENLNSQELIEKLKKNKTDLDIVLIYATELGNFDVLKYVVENGNDEISIDDLNEALEKACQFGHFDLVKYLIEEKLADDVVNALFAASLDGNIEIAKYLIDHGANDFNGALWLAAEYGHINLVKLFVQLGADDFQNSIDYAIYAINNNQSEILEYLESVKSHKCPQLNTSIDNLKEGF